MIFQREGGKGSFIRIKAFKRFFRFEGVGYFPKLDDNLLKGGWGVFVENFFFEIIIFPIFSNTKFLCFFFVFCSFLIFKFQNMNLILNFHQIMHNFKNIPDILGKIEKKSTLRAIEI